VLTHETNRQHKPLFETVEIGRSGFKNRMVGFCLDQRQSGAPPDFDEVLLLWPSDVWMGKTREP
jgi:hypothetical protein